MPFLNIFSRTKNVSAKKPLSVTVDMHEKNSLVAAELSGLGIHVQFQNLKVADYIVNNIAIERKTSQDLISSIINKRIFKQLEEIKQYPKHLLMIEGELDPHNKKSSVNPNAVQGFILSVMLNYNIPVIFTKDSKDSARLIFILANKKHKNSASIRPSKKQLSQKERLQFILEGFPGIGPAKAELLLKKFRTLKNIANAPEDQLREVLGKNAGIFFSLINTPHSSKDV